MNTTPKKNPAKQTIQLVCAVIGVAVALGTMIAMGLSGALPGALFGALGAGGGSLVGWVLSSLLLKEP